MAVISFNKKLFEREIGKLDEKMQEKIALFGTPIEEIKNDEISVDISPNRPDLLSYSGFRRAFLTFIGRRSGIKNYRVYPPEKGYKITIENSVKKIRPYTACAIVKNLKLNENSLKEIIDLQEKLHFTLGRKRKKFAIGIYPLDKIKLPIVYTSREPDKIKFAPLNSNKIMSGLEILQKHPTGEEYASLLAGKERFPIFIDSNKKILSMPPIINSQEVGKVTEKTKEVFIECSGFDLNILKRCLNLIVTSLAENGGKIYSMKTNYGKTPELKNERKKISLENVNKLLGLEITEKQLKSLLEKMGYFYENEMVEIPCYRLDILHEVDLIEDIAIAYGYDNFIPEIPKIATIGKENRKETIKRKLSEILIGLNLIEVSNYHLTNKRDQITNMGIPEKNKDLIEVENSKTDFNLLRENLSSYLLKNLSENIDSEYPQKIFEIGRIFKLEKNKIKEQDNLALAITPGNYTELKQVIEYLFRSLDLKIEIKEEEKFPEYLIDGRTGRIIFNKKNIGYLGEVHPKILRNWKIKMPVSILEISIEEIFKEFDKN
jgi:phenylalanyl-tRNA synthetase beta chain